jgi:3-(3-hydroxy-phenyl)propionate hydroxylase
MQKTYSNPVYPYVSSTDLNAEKAPHHPVVIVGAGPGGLALAIDFASQGICTVVLDDNNTVSVGSRAICFAKRTLEIMNRLGCAQRMIEKGVLWKHGKVFFKEERVYDFDLLNEGDHQIPAFINLQQYYFEEYLVDKVAEFKEIDLRWKSKVIAIDSQKDSTEIRVSVPDGEYTLTCDYLVCADGANSGVRSMLGLESKGQVFQDRFLISDVVMKANFPTERWFWFDPPFHPNQSALLHKQPDNVWRIDLQLGSDADPEHEQQEHVIRPRIQAMLGPETEFDIEWASVYTFQCRKMDHFIHNKVFFVGDAAHQVSPFGARGANGCIQSAENLVWKVANVLKGQAPEALIETYNTERQQGAKENILNSTRSTDFITPKNHISRVFRDQTLRLAKKFGFARTLVNSGRLSTPCQYTDSPLNSVELDTFDSPLCPGSVPKDAPIGVYGEQQWLLNQLGNQFVVLVTLDTIGPEEISEIIKLSDIQNLKILVAGNAILPDVIKSKVTKIDCTKGVLVERYDLKQNTTYLFRPDQIVSGRWRQCMSQTVEKAMRRALGFELNTDVSDRQTKTFEELK